MYEYHIEGGYPVRGTIRASGNKNAALPCIAAALLTDEPIILNNIPQIEDVQVMIDVLESLGGTAEQLAANSWELHVKDVVRTDIPQELSKKIRASILFAGPLLARAGKAVLPPPGGDVIGRRRLDTHFLALAELGARVEVDGQFCFTANKLVGADIFLDEASVTATENAIMAASLAEGTTILSNVACEPHVQDVCLLLTAMGAKIQGIGSNSLIIEGVERLHGAEYAIGPDFMEIGSFIGLAAATRGRLTITNVNPRDLRPIKNSFGKLGIRWDVERCSSDSAVEQQLQFVDNFNYRDSDNDKLIQPLLYDTDYKLIIPEDQELKVNCDLGGMIPKIDDSPWPGFPPDLTSIMTVLATQVDGTVLIHEKMFESRMFFVDKLIGMGARIILCDPHRAVVTGPTALRGDNLVSPDVRAGMAMVIAAMAARGDSVIRNVYQIERGYENLTNRLQALGAHITRISV